MEKVSKTKIIKANQETNMFNKLLIANRGEIALRIARTAKSMGIEPYFVYESYDKNLPHSKMKNSHEIISYSDPVEIVELAQSTGIEAIHPGYGFIAENPKFVKLANDNGIEFVGPSYQSMLKFGNKQLMLKAAKIADIPHIPGVFLEVNDINLAIDEANNIGYPIIVKGKESGGGRQIKLIQTDEELVNVIDKIKRIEQVNEVYIAKFLTNVKHIEVQLLGDKFSDIVALGTRDCSIQRRFQKLIEEAPANTIHPIYQRSIEQTAIEIAHLVDYVNACTVEFLFDENGNYYFMEVNPRLQVEHCVTEEIYNVDIVKQQLLLASGEPLDQSLKSLKPKGHSIQCRINAEDPLNDFRPISKMNLEEYSPLKEIHGQVRYESFLEENMDIPTQYDSLIAKVIVNGKNREDAIKKTLEQLEKLQIKGFPTTREFFKALLNEDMFVSGNHKTNYINIFMSDIKKELINMV
jgi:acetyl/propionyl-CoA carboxylase alpha subunit